MKIKKQKNKKNEKGTRKKFLIMKKDISTW